MLPGAKGDREGAKDTKTDAKNSLWIKLLFVGVMRHLRHFLKMACNTCNTLQHFLTRLVYQYIAIYDWPRER
jgi:hypothetical protein